MPIVYSCIVNRQGTVVVEGTASGYSSYKRNIQNAFNEGKLNLTGQNNYNIDGEYAMDYNKQQQVTWVSIRTHKTVPLLEVKMWFDKLMAFDYLNKPDMNDYNQHDAEQKNAGLGLNLSRDLDAWN